MGWRKNKDDDSFLEIPGLLERRIRGIGAVLSAYPEKRKKNPFTWEVEVGDHYAHGRAKTMLDAQIRSEDNLSRVLVLALRKI